MTAEADFSARPFSMRGEWDGKEDKGTDFLMLKVTSSRSDTENRMKKWEENMEFWNAGVTLLRTVVIVLGAALLTWGAINLMEGYGGDNPGAKSQGIKQMAAGGGVILIGTTLVPMLSGLLG